VTVDTPLANGTSIDNTVTIGSAELADVQKSTSDLVASAPDLSTSSKSAQDQNGGNLSPNDDILYTVTVTNSGTDDATVVVVTDPVPANTTFVMGSITLGGAGKTDVADGDECQLAGGNVVCNAGTVAGSGGSAVVTFQVTVDGGVANGTVLTNTATISSAEVADELPSVDNTVVSANLVGSSSEVEINLTDASTIVSSMGGAGFTATAYNLYRGDLSVLRSSGQYTQPGTQGSQATSFCQVTESILVDTYLPQSGNAVFYLATAMTVDGEGTLGVTSGGLERENANACQ